MVNPNRGQRESKTGAASPDSGNFSLISNEKLIALYLNLLKCRGVGRRGGISNGNSSSMRGGEAAVVGAAIDLGPGDVVCSRGHRLLAGVSDGVPIEKLLFSATHHDKSGTVRGAKTTAIPAARNGFARSAGGPDLTPAAIGTALANKTKKNGKVAVVFCSEEQESLDEALEIASVHALPMVFVNQLDGKAERRGRKSRPSKKEDSSPTETPWFPSIMVDGNDVVAVYRVAGEAIARARLGRGPTLIECRPFRLNGKAENRNGRLAHDPIRNMEHYLRAKGLFDRKLKSDTIADVPRARSRNRTKQVTT